MNDLKAEISLREVQEADLAVFFAFESDPEAVRMAAFTRQDPADWAAFRAHWAKIQADPTVITRAVVYAGQAAGSVASYEMFGETQVTYWIGRAFWGRGIATAALSEFLRLIEKRPVYTRAAKDNTGSIRVLQKCGFVIVGEDQGFANGRGEEVQEWVLRLAGD